MPTISQAEINRLKYKSGLSDADINTKLQEKGYTSPTTTQEAGVTLPWFQTTQPTQTTPSPTPTSGSVSSLLGEIGANDAFAQQYYNEQLANYNAPIDENAIRKQKESEFQAQIDAINAVYADKLRQERTTGQGRLGSSRAIQARSGLIGSDFGTAQTEGVQQLNKQQEASIESERLALVNQILAQAQSSAAAEIAAKRAAREAGGKEYLNYLAGQQTRKQENTSKAAQLLLLNNKTPEDISDAELAQAKISRNDLSLIYSGLKSQQEAEAAKAKSEQEKAALEALKTQSEIDKNQASIINEALKTGRVYEQGGFIFDGATNQRIGSAQAVRRAGGGGGAWWVGSGILGGVWAGGVNSATEQWRLALEQALAQKWLTWGQRQALINLYNSQWVAGLKTYVYNNMLTATQKDEFNNFANGGAILWNVSNEIWAEDEYWYLKDISQSLLSKLWLQDKSYTDLKSRIEVAQAPIRKGLYGTALTGTEAETAKSFLIDFQKDTWDIIKQKSKNLEWTLKYINDANVAANLWLPKPSYYDYINPVSNNKTKKADTKTVAPITPWTLSNWKKFTVIPPQ